MQADLTHAEARTAFLAFAASVSSKATCTGQLSTRGDYFLTAYFQPEGYGSTSPFLILHGDTWRELLAACEAKWAEYSDQHGVNVVREMALAIISITADLGECTDAALRAKFDAADVARYGDRACAQATEMAGLGPFSIVKLSGANDAEAA